MSFDKVMTRVDLSHGTGNVWVYLHPFFLEEDWHMHFPSSIGRESYRGTEMPEWVADLGRTLWRLPAVSLVAICSGHIVVHHGQLVTDSDIADAILSAVTPVLAQRLLVESSDDAS